MLKTKYQRLTKEEKKKARLDFYNTDFGKELKIRFNRILIYSIILFIWAIYLIIDNIINQGSIWIYVGAGFLILFSFIFFFGRLKIISKKVNDYLTKKKK